MHIQDIYTYLDSLVGCNGRSCDDCRGIYGYDECPSITIGENGGRELIEKVCNSLLNRLYTSDDVYHEITVEELSAIIFDTYEEEST